MARSLPSPQREQSSQTSEPCGLQNPKMTPVTQAFEHGRDSEYDCTSLVLCCVAQLTLFILVGLAQSDESLKETEPFLEKEI